MNRNLENKIFVVGNILILSKNNYLCRSIRWERCQTFLPHTHIELTWMYTYIHIERERESEKEREIYYTNLYNFLIADVEKSHDLLSTSWKPKKSQCHSFSLSLKAWKPGEPMMWVLDQVSRPKNQRADGVRSSLRAGEDQCRTWRVGQTLNIL